MSPATPSPLHFGLGEARSVELRVTWPGGAISNWTKVDVDQVLRVRPGDGSALKFFLGALTHEAVFISIPGSSSPLCPSPVHLLTPARFILPPLLNDAEFPTHSKAEVELGQLLFWDKILFRQPQYLVCQLPPSTLRHIGWPVARHGRRRRRSWSRPQTWTPLTIPSSAPSQRPGALECWGQGLYRALC